MNDEQTASIRVTHRFKASAERVYDAWLQPDKIATWMAEPGGGELLHAQVDQRVGGKFSFLLRRNGEDIDHTGEYLELERPRRLKFTWGTPKYSPAMSLISIEIVPAADGCELTLTAERVLEDFAQRTQQGWTRILDALARAA
jgi:uncharacterized protein YndB with AHSA1/START domain